MRALLALAAVSRRNAKRLVVRATTSRVRVRVAAR